MRALDTARASSENERDCALVRVATLEARVGSLSAELRECANAGEALAAAAAVSGAFCESWRRPTPPPSTASLRRDDDAIEAELADVLRALTEVAAERDVPLDALARRIDS